MKFLLRPICWLKGHRRGKSVRTEMNLVLGVRTFACPRCGHETRYKVKPNGISKGSPGDELV